MRLSELEALPSFALLGTGFGGPGFTLLSGLGPAQGDGARLVFAGFEDREPRGFSARAESCEDLEVDVAPGVERLDLLAPGYARDVGLIREAIAAGDVYQVCLTVRARLRAKSGASVFAALASSRIARFAAWVRLPEGTEFVSASPELFFETDGARVRSEPMKGTARPDAGEALARSAKDRRELAMITDLVRNDLTPVCKPKSVRVPCARRLLDVGYAAQAVSDVTGELLPGRGPLDVLRALHPGGSVVGAPKHAALDMISLLERSPRGPYCGTLGLRDGDRSVFSLLIRTATREAGGWVYGVGGGIVYDSDAEAELEEVRTKLGAIACATRS